MRFNIYTLVDITETNVRHNNESKQFYQQQNFQMLIQTIGIRTNILTYRSPVIESKSINQLSFGSRYKGKQNYWIFEFETERSDILNTDMLENDFDLIPIIKNLDETIKIDRPLFETKNHETKNMFFKIV